MSGKVQSVIENSSEFLLFAIRGCEPYKESFNWNRFDKSFFKAKSNFCGIVNLWPKFERMTLVSQMVVKDTEWRETC